MELVELGSILTMNKGKKPSSQSAVCADGMLPYVDIEAFDKGKVQNYTNGERCLPCEEGDVLIVCDGSRSGLVGRARKGFVGSTLAKLTAEGVINDYLYYFVQGKYTLLNTNKKGTGTPHLKPELLKSQKLVVPSKEKQRQIVDRIEELFSNIDNGVDMLLKAREQIRLYKQSVLKAVFFGEEAEQKKLEEVCDFITKGTTPSKNKMNNEGATIPFIKVYNLTFTNALDFSIDPTFVDEETHRGFLARSIVYPGDVLMNIVGPPMGKVSIVPDTYPEWNINQAIARFRCHSELDNKYLAYYLGYAKTVEDMMKKSKATAGQFNLTLEICRNLLIPIPEIEIQRAKVIYLEEKMSVCEKILKTIDDTLQEAYAMRQSILKKAFEGRLD